MATESTLTEEMANLINGLEIDYEGDRVFLHTERLSWESTPTGAIADGSTVNWSPDVAFCITDINSVNNEDIFGQKNKYQSVLFEFQCETASSLSKAQNERIMNNAINKICELQSEDIYNIGLIGAVRTEIATQEGRTFTYCLFAVDAVDYMLRFE